MSHVSVFRTKVKNPDIQVLGEAMQALAQQLGAELVSGEVQDTCN